MKNQRRPDEKNNDNSPNISNKWKMGKKKENLSKGWEDTEKKLNWKEN